MTLFPIYNQPSLYTSMICDDKVHYFVYASANTDGPPDTIGLRCVCGKTLWGDRKKNENKED